jgi:hypothetical protein
MKRARHYLLTAVLQGVVFALASPLVCAEDATCEYVSRKEYEELKAELLAMKKELASLKKSRHAESKQESPKSQAAAADTDKVVVPPAAPLEEPILGTTKFHIAGFGTGTFEARNGRVSNFSATFNPIFLWELTPRLLFESRLEIEPSGSGTNLELEYAELSYLLNDYITLGIGEFLTPSNVFVERFEALWINKLPDRPLAVYDGILPERSFGLQVRGGIPIGRTRANYAFYVSNGPNLNVFSRSRAGTLEFNNFSDNNDDKAFGGRVGFLPIPGVEVGYGFETAQPGTQGTSFADVRSFLQSVDLNITRDSDLLKGRIDLHAQYAWSHVDEAVYDSNGVFGFGPLSFASERDGGYAQIAYRPTKLDGDLVKNLELIVRWDHLSRAPSGLGVSQEGRWTLGLDYWLSPGTVVKAAYEWDNPHGEPNRDAWFLQVATGF